MSAKDKIIFLDIDGVMSKDCFTIEHSCTKYLKKIIRKTNAKVVLSSWWRTNGEQVKYLKEFLSNYNIEIFDSTTVEYPYVNQARAFIISHWLEQNECAAFVILDDTDERISEYYKHNFIHVNGKQCLTKNDAKKAIEILNG